MTAFRYLLRLLIFLFFALNLSIAFAQPKAKLKRFGRQSLVPGANAVYDILNDQQGRLWMAGQGELGFFDGRKFHLVRLLDRSPQTIPLMLREQSNGTIWLMTLDKNLYVIKDGAATLFTKLSSFPEITSKDAIQGFFVDDQDVIHLSFADSGYFQLSTARELTRVKFPAAAQGCLLIDVGEQSNGFFSAQFVNDSLKDLVLLDQQLQPKMRVPMLASESHRLADQGMHYRSYLRLKNGRHLFFRGRYVTVFDEVGNVDRFEYPNRIISAFEDRSGNVWLGTWRDGLYFFPKGELKLKPPVVYLEGKIAAVKAQDFEGGLWITSDGDAIYHMPHPEIAEFRPKGKNEKFISASTDGKSIYFLTDHQKYGWIKGDEVYYRELPDFLKETYKSSYSPTIFFDQFTQNLWITGDQGCAYWDEKSWHWLQFPDSVGRNLRATIAASPVDSSIWVNFYKSLVQIKDFKVHYVSKPFERRIEYMVPAGDSSVYCSDGKKLFRLKNNEIEDLETSFPDERFGIKAIDHHWNHLFIGAAFQAARLFAVSQDSSYAVTYPWRGAALLQANPVFDGDDMYFYKLAGLARVSYDPAHPHDFEAKTQNYHNKKIVELLLKNDTLFALDSDGVIGRYAVPDSTNTLPLPKVGFLKVQINQKDTVLQDHYDLYYEHRLVNISYTHYTFWESDHSEQADLFQYRIKGVYDDWTVTREQQIQLTALSPGDYEVEVKYRRHHGQLWTEPKSITFTMHPIYWQTWWFRSIAAVFILLLGGGIVALRYRALRKRQRLEVQKLQAEQKALQAQMNPHFIFNVMNSIQDLVIKKEEEAAVDGISWFARLVRKNLENSFSLEIPLQKEIETLELYLKLEHLRADQSFKYSIELDDEVESDLVMVPPMLIQPFVENAIWHGIARKLDGERTILVRFEQDDEQLICIIEDSGVGRLATAETPSKKDHGSLGTKITEERLEILAQQKTRDFQLSIEDLKSEDGSALGTRVKLMIPV